MYDTYSIFLTEVFVAGIDYANRFNDFDRYWAEAALGYTVIDTATFGWFDWVGEQKEEAWKRSGLDDTFVPFVAEVGSELLVTTALAIPTGGLGPLARIGILGIRTFAFAGEAYQAYNYGAAAYNSFRQGDYAGGVQNSLLAAINLAGAGFSAYNIGRDLKALRAVFPKSRLGVQFDEYRHFRNQGFTPAQAKYLTQPYGNRAGHHFPIPQRVGRGGLPDPIVDSRFNVLRPRGVSLGRFYELHYRVDPNFFGAAFPRAIGGSWSGRRLGLEKYTGLERIWYATSGPTKVAVGTGIIVIGAGGYWWLSAGNDGE